MARAWNNAEGGTNGTTVTVGNSGGASGNAWDALTASGSGTLVFDNTNFFGSLAYLISCPSTGLAVVSVQWAATIGTVTSLAVRCYLYMTANPGGVNVRLIRFMNGGTEVGAVIVNTSGQLQMRDAGGAIAGNTTATINLNAWCRIEALITCNASTGTIEAKLFNTADGTGATETFTKTGRNTGAQLTNVNFGETVAPGSAITARTFALDDIGADTAGYMGPARQAGTVILSGGIPKGVAVMAATGSRVQFGTGALVGVGATSGTGRLLAGASAALVAVGGVSGAGARRAGGNAALVGVAGFAARNALIGGPVGRHGLGQVLFYAEGADNGIPLKMGNWEVIDQAPGGWVSAQGDIERSVIFKNPWIRDGAVLVGFLKESGAPVFGGRLGDPQYDGDVARLVGSGWANLLEEQVDQFLVLDAFTGDWTALPGDPFPAPWNLAGGGTVTGSAGFQVDTSNGNLKVSVAKGTVFAVGDKAAFAFWAQGQDVHRFAADIHNDNGGVWNAADFRIRIYWASYDPNTGVFGNLTEAATSAFAPTNGGVIETNTHPDGGDVMVVVVRAESASTAAADVSLWLDNIRVTGYSDDDVYGAGELARQVFTNAGLDIGTIDGGGDNVAPMYVRSAPFTVPLLQANLLTDTYYAARGMFRARGDLLRWGTDEWVACKPYIISLSEAPRYFRVRCPFAYPSGKTTGYVEVATPNAPPGRAFTLPLTTPLPSEEFAGNIARIALGVLSKKRSGGQCVIGEVFDRYGRKTSGHYVRSGSLFWAVEAATPLRIATVRHTEMDVTLTFDPMLYTLNRLLARRARGFAMSGVIADGTFSGLSV